MRQLDAGGGYREQIEQEVEQAARRRLLEVRSAAAGVARAHGDGVAVPTCGDRERSRRAVLQDTAERSCRDARFAESALLALRRCSLLLARAGDRAGRHARSVRRCRACRCRRRNCRMRTVTVRVVRERMGNNIAGQAVTLTVGGATRTATTDAQGRAQFDGLPPGTPVHGEADGRRRDADARRSFAVPAKGGVRVALVAGIAAGGRGGKGRGRSRGQGAGAAGRRRVRRRVAHHPRVPGRHLHGVLPARGRQQRAHADRHRRAAADRPADRRRRAPSMMQGSSPHASVRRRACRRSPGRSRRARPSVQVGFSLPQAGANYDHAADVAGGARRRCSSAGEDRRHADRRRRS